MTFSLFEIERWFCHHRLSLVKADRLMYFVTSKGHLGTLNSGHPRSRSRIELNMSSSHWPHDPKYIGCVLTRRTLWHLSHVFISFKSKLVERNVCWPYDVIIGLSWPIKALLMENCTGDVIPNLIHNHSDRFEEIWLVFEVLDFSSIDLKWAGHEIDLTWGQRYKKIWDIRFVKFYARIVHYKFQSVWVKALARTRCQTLENATWHDLENKVISH